MKVVVQRVNHASVKVEGKLISEINKGLLVFLGISKNDSGNEIPWLAKKTAQLRIFEDQNDKMNLTLDDINGEILLVSQFTLYGSCKKGRRPDFTSAAKPEIANKLYEDFALELEKWIPGVKKGIFGADMKIALENDGPVTLIIEKE